MKRQGQVTHKNFLKEAILLIAFSSLAAFGQGRIAFERCSGDCDVYTMNANGTGTARLTVPPGRNSDPSLSADGRKIAFVSNRTGTRQIYVMNPDGSNQIQLTNEADNITPAISPNGRRIAFASNRTGIYKIYVMNSDGSNLIQLTNAAASENSPSFRHDGLVITFASQGVIHVINADGSNLRPLDVGLNPSFGPIEDGRIVFSRLSSTFGGNFNVWVMNPDGTNQLRLTDVPEDDLQPSMGPNGRIVYASGPLAGTPEIWVMNANGTNPTQLTFGSSSSNPSWGAYVSPTSAAVEVSGRVLTSHGSGVTNATIFLTDSLGNTRGSYELVRLLPI